MESQAKTENIKRSLVNYVIENHRDDLLRILETPDDGINFAVYIDVMDLLASVLEATDFFQNARLYLDLLNISLKAALKMIFDEEGSSYLSIKNRVYVRLISLPEEDQISAEYPDVNHVNKLICFNGTVTKASSVRMLEFSQTYACTKCGTEIVIKIDYGYEDLLVKPSKCSKESCPSDKLAYVNTEKNFKSIIKDYQEIKVQEKFDKFSSGSVPRSLLVILEDDLVDSCKPGDDVTINGVVIERWGRLANDMRCDVSLILHANSLKVNNDDQSQVNLTKEKLKGFTDFWAENDKTPMTARNIILSSFCPQLYGMYIVKLAVCLVLAGGVSRKDASGTRVRGESHLLLVGDPGTGKSQFLKYANKLIPRSILTTGIGSTSAGLTATASRDGGIWHLEAGALVLADGGICCVDEFNCMKEQDRASMLEAMEQQSISVAKAGIVCKLKTQCSVLAACNPKGAYDSNQPITVNVAISSPLLSRFDVVLLLLDSQNKEWDHLASMFLLQGRDLLKEKNSQNEKLLWPFDQLKLYINHVKTLEPDLTPDANTVIQRYYQLQRKLDARNAARTTVRMLESVIRLSQAHAKLMMRKKVFIMDAVVAITLMECSLNKTASFGDVNILHTSFPENSEIEYKNQVELILTKLDLNDLLVRELEFIDKNMKPFCSSRNSSQILNASIHNFDIISQMIGDISNKSVHRSNNNISLQNSNNISNNNNSSKSNMNSSVNESFNSSCLEEKENISNDRDRTLLGKKRKLMQSILSQIDEDELNETRSEENKKSKNDY